MDNRLSQQMPAAAVVRAEFEKLADAYDQHAALEQEVATRLLERVVHMKHEPIRVVDLGCGTGFCASQLKRMFRKAEVIALDFAMSMCRLATRRSSFLRPLRTVCADIHHLPLATRSVDLVVANLSLQWTPDWPRVFNELRRVLLPGGMLLFSFPGTDSLKELRTACEAGGLSGSVSSFPDMHDVGDALLTSGFMEPVMMAEMLTLTYSEPSSLLCELRSTGSAIYCPDFRTVEEAQDRIMTRYPREPGPQTWPVSWEIVYGMAFGPREGQPIRSGGAELATFSVEALKASRRSG